MYAKWINPKKIIPFTGEILRHDGKITVNPSAEQLCDAGYYPVVLEDGLNPSDPMVIFYEMNREIHLIREENI